MPKALAIRGWSMTNVHYVGAVSLRKNSDSDVMTFRALYYFTPIFSILLKLNIKIRKKRMKLFTLLPLGLATHGETNRKLRRTRE